MRLVIITAIKRQTGPIDLPGIAFQQLYSLLKFQHTYILLGIDAGVFSEKADEVFVALSGLVGYFPDRGL